MIRLEAFVFLLFIMVWCAVWAITTTQQRVVVEAVGKWALVFFLVMFVVTVLLLI